MDEKIFGGIPLRSWRWLGVNDIKSAAHVEEKIFAVPADETLTISEVNAGDENVARRIKISVGERGRVEFVAADIGGGNYSADVEIDLSGDDAAADFTAVYFGSGKRKLDLNYVIRQRGKRTQATMTVRGALKDNCDKIFRGTLDFQRGAKGSTGREFEEVVILSPNTRNRSVPLMLAAEDEVDGHHAVSVGKIDDEKIFYLMSRGLDTAQAQRLIVEAAFAPVIEKIPDENLRGVLTKNLQRRLADG